MSLFTSFLFVWMRPISVQGSSTNIYGSLFSTENDLWSTVPRRWRRGATPGSKDQQHAWRWPEAHCLGKQQGRFLQMTALTGISSWASVAWDSHVALVRALRGCQGVCMPMLCRSSEQTSTADVSIISRIFQFIDRRGRLWPAGSVAFGKPRSVLFRILGICWPRCLRSMYVRNLVYALVANGG